MVASYLKNLKNRLIRDLQRFPRDWALTPLLGDKAPYRPDWQNEEPLERSHLAVAIQQGELVTYTQEDGSHYQVRRVPQGIGIRTGVRSAGLVALDLDGESALELMLQHSGGKPLLRTVAFTSGRPGRCQYLLRVPQTYWDAVKTVKYKTGVIGDDGKPEQLEYRWDGCQSVLPPSVHPLTGMYRWLDGCAPWECEIAVAPMWVIEKMLGEYALNLHSREQGVEEENAGSFADTGTGRHGDTGKQEQNSPRHRVPPSPRPPIPAFSSPHPDYKRWTARDWALSYLNALSSCRADDYEQWLAVGMALKSVDESLLTDWDSWSQQSPKYKPGVCEKKWKSFKSTGVSIGTLAHMAKQDGWRSPTHECFRGDSNHNPIVSDSSRGKQGSREGGNSPTGQAHSQDGNGSDGSSINSATLRLQVLEILERNLSPSELTEAFAYLATSTGRQLREIRELAQHLEADLDREDSRTERLAEIQALETKKHQSLNLGQYLPAAYADPMTRMAQWMEAPPAVFLTGLLSIFASCLHAQTRVIVKQSIGFIEPAIIYAGLVTESGQRKSPLINALFDALRQLQAEEEERYRQDKADYDAEYEQWQSAKDSYNSQQEWKNAEPTRPTPLREFYVDKGTIEAIDQIKATQPGTGLLWLKDELSGLFSSYGAYKGGRGEDRESVLSGWNGRGIKKNLKGGERVSLLHDSMSIFGAIQDTKLQKLMGSFDDEQGEWGRFLWVIIPLKALRLPEDDTTFQLSFLKDLYADARTLAPQNYRFAFDAQALFDQYHWKLEQQRVSHPQQGMRAAIAKMEGYTARIAMLLHILWELEAGKKEPSPYIPKQRVMAAIQLSEFYLSQVTLIHCDGAAALGEGNLAPKLSAILTKLQQFGVLSARKLQASISWLRKATPSSIRNDLIELARLGYGKLQGKGNRLKLVLTAETVDKSAADSADSPLLNIPIEIGGIQDFDGESADSAEPIPTLGARHPQRDAHSFSQSELPCVLEQLDEQPSQHINTWSVNPEQSSPLAADEVSTVESTLSTVESNSPLGNLDSLREAAPENGGFQPSSSPYEYGDSCEMLTEEVEEREIVGDEQELIEVDSDAAPVEQSSPTSLAPALEELKAQLLAVKSLTALNQLKRQYLKMIGSAYQLLSQQQFLPGEPSSH